MYLNPRSGWRGCCCGFGANCFRSSSSWETTDMAFLGACVNWQTLTFIVYLLPDWELAANVFLHSAFIHLHFAPDRFHVLNHTLFSSLTHFSPLSMWLFSTTRRWALFKRSLQTVRQKTAARNSDGKWCIRVDRMRRLRWLRSSLTNQWTSVFLPPPLSTGLMCWIPQQRGYENQDGMKWFHWCHLQR